MPRWVWTLCFGLLALPALAQSPLLPAPTSDDTATAPAQLRRAEPPSASASAEELEERGDQLRGQNSYADAIDYYRAALAKSDSAVLHNKIGMARLRMLHLDNAKKEFERAIKRNPAYAEAQNNLGVVHYMQNDYKKAIRRYQKALELKEASSSFHSNLGTAYFARKEYDKASKEYLRALELDPEIFERQSSTGVSAHMVSRGDRARFSYVIAKIYARSGDADRCLLYLKKALEDGYAGISDVYKDEEFSQVRKDPRFTELMASKPVAVSN